MRVHYSRGATHGERQWQKDHWKGKDAKRKQEHTIKTPLKSDGSTMPKIVNPRPKQDGQENVALSKSYERKGRYSENHTQTVQLFNVNKDECMSTFQKKKESAKDHAMKHCEQTSGSTGTTGDPTGRKATSSSSTQWRESAKWHEPHPGEWHDQHWWEE